MTRATGSGLFLCLLALLCTSSCEHADPLDAGSLEATLTNVQATVFDRSCALSGCHDGGSTTSLPGIMDLREGRAHANLVGVRSLERPNLFRVAPNDPDNSYLVKKIQGDPDIGGSRMPLNLPALSTDQLDLIREWIGNGALDD